MCQSAVLHSRPCLEDKWIQLPSRQGNEHEAAAQHICSQHQIFQAMQAHSTHVLLHVLQQCAKGQNDLLRGTCVHSMNVPQS